MTQVGLVETWEAPCGCAGCGSHEGPCDSVRLAGAALGSPVFCSQCEEELATPLDQAWLWAMVAQAGLCQMLEVAAQFLAAADLAYDLDDPTSPLHDAVDALEEALLASRA